MSGERSAMTTILIQQKHEPSVDTLATLMAQHTRHHRAPIFSLYPGTIPLFATTRHRLWKHASLETGTRARMPVETCPQITTVGSTLMAFVAPGKATPVFTVMVMVGTCTNLFLFLYIFLTCYVNLIYRILMFNPHL